MLRMYWNRIKSIPVSFQRWVQLLSAALWNGYLLGFSQKRIYTGNAKNICQAAITAKERGLKVIGLTGMGGGKLADLCDCCIQVPETETFKVQELHLPVYHCICAVLEAEFFK